VSAVGFLEVERVTERTGCLRPGAIQPCASAFPQVRRKLWGREIIPMQARYAYGYCTIEGIRMWDGTAGSRTDDEILRL
jgi:hypothetical protein